MASATTLGRGGSRPGETYYTQPKSPAKTTTPAKSTTTTKTTTTAPKATTTTPAKTAATSTSSAGRETIYNNPTPSDLPYMTDASRASFYSQQPSAGQYGGGSSANDYYDRALSQLEEQRRAQEEAARIRTQQTIDSINSNIPLIDQNYEDQQRQNYIASTKSQFGLTDYLKAMGYSGGMSESKATELQANYQNARNTADQNKNNAMDNIRQYVAQAQSTGDTNLAQIATDFYQQYASMAQAAAQQQEATRQWQLQYDAQQANAAQNDYTSTIGAYSNDYMAEYNRLIGMGYSPDSFEARAILAARNQKISGQQQSTADKEQQDLENYIKLTQLNYNVNKPYYNPNSGGSTGYSRSDIIAMLNAGLITEAQAQQMLGIQ